MLTLALWVSIAQAGEREDFVRVAEHEMRRRCESITQSRMDVLANEIWDSAEKANKEKWFRYPVNPRWLVTRGCVESNWHNVIADKTKDGKPIPMWRWSVGFFHVQVIPWFIQAEALGIDYHYPIRDYILNHTKQQVWVANRFQAMWLDMKDGNVTEMVEIYFFGYTVGGTSKYYKTFKQVYESTWGEELPKTVEAFK